MHFKFKKPNTNIIDLIRQAGYSFRGRVGSEMAFMKRVGLSEYPHFHIYLKEERENYILNLHLDQKEPSYKGAPKHGAEHSSELVVKEMERIKNTISNF